MARFAIVLSGWQKKQATVEVEADDLARARELAWQQNAMRQVEWRDNPDYTLSEKMIVSSRELQ